MTEPISLDEVLATLEGTPQPRDLMAALRASLERAKAARIVATELRRTIEGGETNEDAAARIVTALGLDTWPTGYQPDNPHVTAARQARDEVERLQARLVEATGGASSASTLLEVLIQQRDDASTERDNLAAENARLRDGIGEVLEEAERWGAPRYLQDLDPDLAAFHDLAVGLRALLDDNANTQTEARCTGCGLDSLAAAQETALSATLGHEQTERVAQEGPGQENRSTGSTAGYVSRHAKIN